LFDVEEIIEFKVDQEVRVLVQVVRYNKWTVEAVVTEKL
jgi:hypothetical protein